MSIRRSNSAIIWIRYIKLIFLWEFLKFISTIGKCLRTVNFIRKADQSFYPEETRLLEDSISKLSNCDYVITTTNGTKAIETALYSADLKYKKIGCAINMIPSSYYPAKILNNEIIPIQLNPRTLTVDENALEKLCKNSNIDGLIFCDFYGVYENLNRIREICIEYEIPLIRDCSHSHHYINKKEGKGPKNEIICYSFQSSKPISAYEGGAICTNDKNIAEKSIFYISQDKFLIRCKQKGIKLISNNYDTNGYGYKSRINPIGASSALVDINLIDFQNYLYERSVYLSQEFINDLKIPVKSLHNDLKNFSSGCNNLVFIGNSELETKNTISSLMKVGIGSSQKFYNLEWINDLDDGQAQVKEETLNLFSRLLFINIFGLFSFKRLLIILLRSTILKWK